MPADTRMTTRPTLRRHAHAAADWFERLLEEAGHARATARGRRFLQDKTSVRGRSCHCDPDLPLHLVHSEGLREHCDIVVDYHSNVTHPDRPQVPEPVLARIAGEIGDGDTIHVKADRLEAFIRHVLPGVTGSFVLVTGDSDVAPVATFRQLLDDRRLIHWFAQNCDLTDLHPRLTRVPIGIDNPVYTKPDKRLGFLIAMLLGRTPFDPTLTRNGMGDQAVLQAMKRKVRPLRERPLRVLCTFHRNQQLISNADTIPDRVDALAALRDHPDCHVVARRLRQDEYWRAHDDFAFEAAPRGKGLDCFRTWECLFLETIPIVRSSPLDALYRQEGFPVVVVESYREVTTENLRKWKAELEGCFTDAMYRKLTNDCWVERIRAVTARHRAGSCRPG